MMFTWNCCTRFPAIFQPSSVFGKGLGGGLGRSRADILEEDVANGGAVARGLLGARGRPLINSRDG